MLLTFLYFDLLLLQFYNLLYMIYYLSSFPIINIYKRLYKLYKETTDILIINHIIINMFWWLSYSLCLAIILGKLTSMGFNWLLI